MNSSDQGFPSVPYERVILVDSSGAEVGTAEKLSVHQSGGQLHQAVSVLIFNDEQHILLQKRTAVKYHFPSLWSNACCTHPRPGEPPHLAAHRRLRQELGFDTPLEEIGKFIYRAESTNGLCEYELDFVFRGTYCGSLHPDPHEIAEWRWWPVPMLLNELCVNCGEFTPWLKIITENFL